ncbi:DUF6807 domain-containing protein [Parenemella sanctibonifatiensis]|uniref:Oxidoreductase n=1 Tax=Parenemella sanctibonifatiensis TaxID=2016505 RepID=A0A255EBR1_9ACTN|nr:PmoA family protein [Parenemella sanctibonifatiensis]OYN88994.1 hypothetical protein CGZ91_12005 [Parenemella sanctibonifatiensis]
MRTPQPEPVRPGLSLTENFDVDLAVHHTAADGSQVQLVRYVYHPWEPQLESPRPYFHPIRTLGGNLVSLYRPHDHVWHKGIAYSLPNVGEENFWGGVTYVRDQGYQQLDNNGAMVHTGFTSRDHEDDRIRAREELRWVTQAGAEIVCEERDFTIRLLDDTAWVLEWGTRFTNISEQTFPMGSPTTHGREMAGYGGLFWRGPRSFTGGKVYADGHSAGDEDLMGIDATWMAYVGQHDEIGGASTVAFVDQTPEPRHGGRSWFVRTQPFAVISPSPFFFDEVDFAPKQTFSYRYSVIIADGERQPSEIAELVASLDR